MDTPSTTTCIFCGRERDLQRSTCPSCGRGWIDRRLPGSSSAPWVSSATTEPADGTSGPVVHTTAESELHPTAAPAKTSTPPETPYPQHRLRWPWLIASAFFLVVATVAVVLFVTQPSDNLTAPTTTVPDTTAAPTSTTAAPTTTTSSTTTTTTTTLPPITADGEAIPLEELTLGAFALGPFTFGNSEVLPRLVATFDQPDTISPAAPESGLCEGVDGIDVTWGSFTTTYTVEDPDGDPADAVLVGYRLDGTGVAGGETSDLVTLSGLALGATVAELEEIYAGFAVTVDEEGGSPRYVVTRTADSTTMLWGPLTAADETGTVEGIHSPLPCDGGAGT